MLFLVTTDIGFETVLMEELRELEPSIRFIRVFSGRILFEAQPLSGILAALRSRIANNVYVVLHHFTNINSLDDIYKAVKSIDFTNVILPNESFAIRPERIGEHGFTSIDIGRVAGQAVIDSYLEARGIRLRVDLDNPDIEIYTELNRDKLYVALGITRTSLHKRGYRVFNHPAALKTTIACALLRIAGWTPGRPVLDPMCGGGTILIEAALASKGIEIPCFKLRELESNPVIDRVVPGALNAIKKLCREVSRDVRKRFIGIEINPRFAEGAVINAKSAGVDDMILFVVGDATKLLPRIVEVAEKELDLKLELSIFNPPYGQRMKPKDLENLYKGVVQLLRDLGFKRVVFITSAIDIAEKVLMELDPGPTKRLYVVHGTLPSYVYSIELS
ncbi:MAG TPA: class I SAM-dependent RNA methyltransferase [Ignisphaera aggregans]|uniref:Class I SAM-dependent RNA methyltransferase n=1 Tax=Ignisphaera aggregans TaxID=334771 RepID=A0A833DV81_9CREN|nr:class I SAM-dependent RNA methyltransferase [Ignisphaera aggregans]